MSEVEGMASREEHRIPISQKKKQKLGDGWDLVEVTKL